MGSCLGWKTEEQWTKKVSLGPLSCKTKSKKETSDGRLRWFFVFEQWTFS